FHKHTVKQPSPKEHEDKRGDECEEKIFPVHGFMTFTLIRPEKPRSFIAKSHSSCRSKLRNKTSLICESFAPLLAQRWNVTVTHEGRAQFAFVAFSGALNLKIEDAYPIARLALINSAVACAHHDASSGFAFPAEINHRVGNRRIAFD